MNLDHLRDSIQRGLNWLGQEGQAGALFPSVRSRNAALTAGAVEHGAVFPVAVVLRSLGVLDARFACARIVQSATRFLIGQRDVRGRWSYTRGGVEPDADDTAVCLELTASQMPLSAKASCVAQLMSSRDGEGRFLTWMETPAQDNVVDAVVNANVLCALGDGPALAPVTAYLSWCLGPGYGPERWPFYVDERSFLYSVARAIGRQPGCIADGSALLRDRLASLRPAAGALACAEQLAASVRCGALTFDKRASLAEQIMSQQDEHGGWPAQPYYVGPKVPTPPSYWFGGAAMTTALAVEALGLLAVEFDD